MNKVKIDKNIPMPPARPKGQIYPWEEMEIGDSFLSRATTASLAQYANNKYKPKHFRVGLEGKYFRVWRDA
jgi:hypothetical protein